MSFAGPVLIIFHGATGRDEAERMMAAARVRAARRTAATALTAGFERVVLVTDAPEAFGHLPAAVLVDTDAAGERFAFDARLRQVVDRYGLRKPAVIGSGSLPLLGESEFRSIAGQLGDGDGFFLTNNFFSADITAWSPGEAVASVGPFVRDNMLPRRLRDDAGLAQVVLPRTTATQFDLDTPADLAVLSLMEGVGQALVPPTTASLLPLERYRALMPVFSDRDAQLVVAGRVGSMTWQHLERETACRVRVFSEERGLATAPADHRPRSLLGMMVEALGVERFFERLMELGDGFVIDTRVVEAHMGVEPSREDRFQSDLFASARIRDPFLREFTAAAAMAPKPVLLGGHSLVSGGLMALNDAAWLAHDRQ